MRPYRLRIMPLRQARARRKVAVRLTAMTVFHSSSFMRMNRLSFVTPALLTRMSTPPRAASAAGTQRLDGRRIGEIAGKHMDAGRQRGGEGVQRIAAGAGQCDGRALAVQCAAIASPMPPLAPVTRAVLPVRSNILRRAPTRWIKPALDREEYLPAFRSKCRWRPAPLA